jgi:GMP synthase (glutamine-hydrolysing)
MKVLDPGGGRSMAITQLSVIDCGTERLGHIHARLEALDVSFRTVPLDRANGELFRGDGGIIISGGPHLFTEAGGARRLGSLFAFIRRIKIPALGICLGHQAMGMQHGVKVYRGIERKSTDRIRILSGEHPLVRGLGPEVDFAKDHCEGIPLPPGFSLLGSSVHYPVEIMASEEKLLFGVQFHPEISGEPGKILFRNFVDIVRKNVTE